jgi:hypothetical protein
MIITPENTVNLYMIHLMDTLNEYHEEQNNQFNNIMSYIILYIINPRY